MMDGILFVKDASINKISMITVENAENVQSAIANVENVAIMRVMIVMIDSAHQNEPSPPDTDTHLEATQ